MAYATEQDLADYLGVSMADLPADAERLLQRASEEIDYWTLGRASEGEATKLAACAQVEWWLQLRETLGTDLAGLDNIRSFSLGKWSMTFGDGASGGGGMRGLAPRARQYLLLAGLLFRGVRAR